MWNRIEEILSGFKPLFSRVAAYAWYVVIIIGLMIRSDRLGLTSVIRDLSLRPEVYESMLHFFRSDAWNLERVRSKWAEIVSGQFPLFEQAGRCVLIGDGTKQSKEGRHMPGVKKLAQESETQSKPDYIHGHFWGCLGVLIGSEKRLSCVPLSARIHDGLQATKDWDGSAASGESHVVEMIKDGCQAAQAFRKDSFYLLDRYFPTVPAFKELMAQNAANSRKVDMVSGMKLSTVAYRTPLPRQPGQRGRKAVKGEKVKLADLFETEKAFFRTGKINLYGRKQSVQYYAVDLLWGQGLYQKLRFVLVECGASRVILVSTNLNLHPAAIIRLYGYRFRIESMFREFKQELGGFSYRFWTKASPRLNRFRRKDAPDPLSAIVAVSERARILKTVRATEMYALMCSVAMGVLQTLSVEFPLSRFAPFLRYQRTPSKDKPSEANLMIFLRSRIFSLLTIHARNEIPAFIARLQIDFSSNSA